jgi:6-phosphofructokinase 2
MAKIITITMNPALDKSATVANVVPEDKLRCSSPSWQPGGGGINVARVAHRMGATPLAVFPAGGHTCTLLTQMLLDEGISTSVVPVLGTTRESLAVYEEATGLQYRFNFPGPELSEADCDNCLSTVMQVIEPESYLVLSGSLPPGVSADFYGRLVEATRAHGVRLIVDSIGDPLRSALAAGVYLIKPNLRELHQFAGRVLERESDQEDAAMKLIETGQCEVVLVSLGAAGVMLITEDGVRYLRAPTVPIRSKVGAGDSMVGGLVWSLAQGHDLVTAVRYGVAAGSACVMTPGTELAYQEDVERLYQVLVASAELGAMM